MTTDLPLITVITVVFNGAQHIEETIKSVLSQRYPRIEYIIVDGGSTDGTLEIIDAYRSKIAVCISEPDNGIYDAMNKGMTNATGEWINFLNGGDRFHSDQTLSDIFTLADHRHRDFIYGDSIIFSSNSQRLIKAKSINNKSLKSGMEACHQAMFVRRSISPRYNLKYRYKAEYNWVVDIFNSIDEQRAEHLSVPVVYYALGGFSERGLLKNLIEFVRICVARYGIWQTTKNSPQYAIIFLRYLKYKLSGHER